MRVGPSVLKVEHSQADDVWLRGCYKYGVKCLDVV